MPKKNPFAAFAATTTKSSGGWMTTKKRGRDDAIIQRDQKRAKDARKKPSAKKKPAAAKKKKKQESWIDDDDEEDDDSFIADDDDEEPQDWSEGDDDDDDLDEDNIVPRGKRKNVRAAPKKKKNGSKKKRDDDDEEEDDFMADEEEEAEDWSERSDDDDDEELDETTTNIVPPRGKRTAQSSSSSSSPKWKDDHDDEFIDTPTTDRKKQQPRNKPVIQIDDDDEEEEAEFHSDDDDDDEDEIDITPTKKKKQSSSSNYFSKKKKKSATTSPEESDEDSVIVDVNEQAESPLQRQIKQRLARKTIQAAKQKKQSKKMVSELLASSGHAAATTKKPKTLGTQQQQQQQQQQPIDITTTTEDEPILSEQQLDADYTSSEDATKKNDKRFKKKKQTTVEVVDDDTDDEGVFSPLQKKSKAAIVSSTDSSKTTGFFNDDDDEDADVVVVVVDKPKKKDEKKKKKRAISDDDDDADEELAMALALSESQASYEKQNKKSKTTVYKDDVEEEPLVDDDAMEEEEDEDQDEFGGEHMDETQDERQAAAAKVLQTANQLSQQVLQNMIAWNCGTDGMIVDGTLALHSSTMAPSSSSWISDQQLKEILPTVKLADYQVIGVNWLALLHNMKADIGEQTNVNGILADVMGLGKTVQTIAFLAWLKHTAAAAAAAAAAASTKKKGVNKPHIIIVPASVLDNWMGEFKKFAPQLTVVKYHGSMADRQDMKYDLERRLPRRKNKDTKVTGDVDVVLTTFSYFSGNKADDRAFLRRFDFDYMVVDEAHCLKNAASNAYQNLDKLETAHRLLLTGTPVQNSPKELMSLICFLMPLFKTAGSIWDDDEDGKTNDGGARMLDYFVTLEGGDAKSDEAAYRKLKQLFAPFVLRRRKEDVLANAIPPKTREVIRVPLTPEMRKLYDSILASHLQGKTNKKSVIPGNAATRLHLFSTLRKVANHPLLLRNRHKDEAAIEHLSTQLRMYGYFGHDESCSLTLVKREVEQMSDFNVHHAALEVVDEIPQRRKEMKRYMLNESDLFCSPKLERLRTLIPELVEKGHRLLIFSQWTNCLDLLGCLLESLHMKFFRLDGQTQISTRQDMIDDFNKDKSIPVFLLSTKAGGMGINLTAADVCILHDLDFNPFNDLQAEDRCHRIGQTKPVRVIKMVTMDTVDDDIYEMQERKKKMNAAILEKGGTTPQEEKKKDTAEIKSMLQNQLDRYLSSSSNKDGGGGGAIDKFFTKKI